MVEVLDLILDLGKVGTAGGEIAEDLLAVEFIGVDAFSGFSGFGLAADVPGIFEG